MSISFWKEAAANKDTFAVMKPDGDIIVLVIYDRDDTTPRHWLGFGGAEWNLLVPSRSFDSKDDVVSMKPLRTNNCWYKGKWDDVPETIKPLFIKKGVAMIMS